MELLKNILKENFKIQEDIDRNTNLIDEYAFESIALIELASLISDKIGVKIPSNKATNWDTVGSIVDTIVEMQAK